MLTEYEHLDLGCSEGGFVEFCRGAFGKMSTLGIDINPGCERFAQEKGYDFLCVDFPGDSWKLDSPGGPSRFGIVTASHFLEHLKSWSAVEESLDWACRRMGRFLMATGPAYDCDSMLRSVGRRFYWADWNDHVTPVSASGIDGIMRGICRRSIGLDYAIFGSSPVQSSAHGDVVPVSVPSGAGPRPIPDDDVGTTIFIPPLFCSYTLFAWKGDAPEFMFGYRSAQDQRLLYWRR